MCVQFSGSIFFIWFFFYPRDIMWWDKSQTYFRKVSKFPGPFFFGWPEYRGQFPRGVILHLNIRFFFLYTFRYFPYAKFKVNASNNPRRNVNLYMQVGERKRVYGVKKRAEFGDISLRFVCKLHNFLRILFLGFVCVNTGPSILFRKVV